METTAKLYEVQPEWCRQPLEARDFTALPEYMQRILSLDPAPIYERIAHLIDPFNRYNYVSFVELFPAQPGFCACGCGRESSGTYYDKECQFFAIAVWEVIGGRQAFMGEIFKAYQGNDLCSLCNKNKFVDIDHRHPVSSGGGGCWLSGFQPLCKKCHKAKTREDFGWQKLKTTKE